MNIPDIRKIQDVFFDAMAAGWAGKPEKIKFAELPGSKGIPFVQGDFQVIDLYWGTEHSQRSEGLTVISYERQPVWTMHYGGWYDKEVIPFLKSCLRQAYVEQRYFYGGRGPKFVQSEGGKLKYFNVVEINTFTSFSGSEHILDQNGQFRGRHWYRGGSLLE